MGDVYDAMNRQRKEQGGQDHGPDSSQQPEQDAQQSTPDHQGSADQPREAAGADEQAADGTPGSKADAGDANGGLPIDEVEEAARHDPYAQDAQNDDPNQYDSAQGGHDDIYEQPAAGYGGDGSGNGSGINRPPQRMQPARPAVRPVDPSTLAESSLNGYAPDVVVHHDRGSVITEQYRAIRTQVIARSRNRRVQTHVITSSAPEEGKSVTTVNLGVAFSELRSNRTLLLEGDLRRPSFEKLFDRKCRVGLLQVLRGEVDDLEEAIQPTVYDNLQFMPAGGKDFSHSTELLSSPRMAQLLDRLRDRYDHIFIDSPPVITVTDACILGSMSDQTLLVVRLNKTPVEVVDRSKRLLRASNCDLAGIILTHLELETSRYLYRYGYTYT